ncbi:MAG: DUF4125 family protein [Lachnospiraceae bacterium]|nr:DUF4125 family protein [Lachnospiraceae bacterium]
MDINKIVSELDSLFTEQNQATIEHFLEVQRETAQKEADDNALLILYNETIGFYRETGEYQKSMEMCDKALKLASAMQLEGSTAYATTLLNVANAKRAAGRLQESLDAYMQVFPVYEKTLGKQDMYYANLYNNISLLYQEMQEYAKAKEMLLKALEIAKVNAGTEFEVAVTYANLANTCIVLGESKQAKEYAQTAITMFEEQQVDDAHYSAALSALGTLYYQEGEYLRAIELVEKSRECVARYLGRNNIQYERLSENIRLIRSKFQAEEGADIKGLELCRRYYEEFGKRMIAEKFPEYEQRIAVGLVGKGSDCFGFDDVQSRDHDFGPRFVMWVTKETYAEIGEALQCAYEELPSAYLGVERTRSISGRGRDGVVIIEDFYKNVTGMGELSKPVSSKAWLAASEYGLAAAVNGEVFYDAEGIFTEWRKHFLAYYPRAVWYRRIAEEGALFAQNGQYNLPRMRKRGQLVAAELARAECVKHAMKLAFLLERSYAPHDKWLYRGLQELEMTGGTLASACARVGQTEESVTVLLERLSLMSVEETYAEEMTLLVEKLAVIFAGALELLGIVGRADAYLDANTQEILIKSDALLSIESKKEKGRVEELALQIAKAEFEAFDEVQNEGGRASCQNNWRTFRIMRMSQYLTWEEEMLLQYLADFKVNFSKGRNMVEEKYARMMASTAPERYAEFAQTLPAISEEKRRIMEEIIRLQVQWMEEFAEQYPGLADNARVIHTGEDTPYDTSYETYLRGELGTYSDKMLELYGRYIVAHAQAGTSVAREIMRNTVQFYGYGSFEEAMEKNQKQI